MQVAFYFAGEITQVLDAIPWVCCASGNVFSIEKLNGMDDISLFWNVNLLSKISSTPLLGDILPFQSFLVKMSCDSCKLSDYPIFTKLKIENTIFSPNLYNFWSPKDKFLQVWHNYDPTRFKLVQRFWDEVQNFFGHFAFLYTTWLILPHLTPPENIKILAEHKK